MTKTLNEWLAENVMKWKFKKIIYGSGGRWPHWVDTDGNTVDKNREGFHPDTDHNDAFRVVEKMEYEHLTIERSDGDWWVCFIGDGDHVDTWFSDDHASLPLAICLAAYKAIEGKEWSDDG